MISSHSQNELIKEYGNDDDFLQKENVLQLYSNLTNIVAVLEKAFKHLKKLQGKNIILAVGNTGCGKSTLLSSLMYGPEALQLQKIQFQIQVPLQNGEMSTKNKIKYVIEHSTPLKAFKIGHSDHESETFLPTYVKWPTKDIWFVDIAGLNDTGGELMDFCNTFIIKNIFQVAKSVKFIIPIPLAQINDSRGRGPREQIQVVQRMCSLSLEEMNKSILPVITKVKPNDENFDLDNVKHVMNEQFEQEVMTQR